MSTAISKLIRPLSKDQRTPIETLDSSLTAPFPSVPSEMTHLCGVSAHDGHQSFKVNQTAPGDAPPTFEMLGPPSLAAAPNAIRLRFRITDTDGIHQVRLHTPEWDPYVAGEFIACKHVNGTSATVEFVTTELSPRSESVHLWMIDVHGNFIGTWHEPYLIDVATILPPATTVSIPDAKLAATIRQKIGNITTHSLLNLRTIDARNHTGITDLTGLAYAYNLKYLHRVHDGQITDLSPLANLIGLTSLDLWKHQIRDMTPLQNLTNLMGLYMAQNDLTDITALRNLTKLRWLDLGGNALTDITVLRNLTHLTWLHIGGNDLQDISALGNLTDLMDLGLGVNDLHDITALGNLTKLRWLDLGGNALTDITALGNLTHLRTLYLWWNQITDVGPLVGLVNLEELYIEGNPIEDLSPLRILLANNPNLKIDIDIPQLPPLAFSPSAIADQTFRADEVIQPLRLPVATGGDRTLHIHPLSAPEWVAV